MENTPYTNQTKIIQLIKFMTIFVCITTISEVVAQGNEFDKQELTVDKEYQEVFDQLRANDSLLFDLGFNKCDTNQIKKLTSDDFEFYHDQAGITDSKEAFIQSIKGLCNMSYRPTRELDVNSLEVHLLRNNGTLYGAIQNGKHKLYGEEENKPKYLTSTADFTHLWIIEDEIWKLKRVLSFNHQVPK